MDKLKLAGLAALFIVLGGGAVFGTYQLTTHFLNGPKKTTSQGCNGEQANHLVEIKEDKMIPLETKAKLCETLTIFNKDIKPRLIAFGPHDSHITYDGITERLLRDGESFTITMNKAGTYRFHDHVDDTVAGYFTVVKP